MNTVEINKNKKRALLLAVLLAVLDGALSPYCYGHFLFVVFETIACLLILSIWVLSDMRMHAVKISTPLRVLIILLPGVGLIYYFFRFFGAKLGVLRTCKMLGFFIALGFCSSLTSLCVYLLVHPNTSFANFSHGIH
jgi:hypothetical protein